MTNKQLEHLRDQSLAARLKRALGGIPTLTLRTADECPARPLAPAPIPPKARQPFSRWTALQACARISGDIK